MQKDEEIHIVPYNASWILKFEEEKQQIEKVLSSWITGGVHHVGSTAIPGLSAKPIIDIMVGVDNIENSKACVELLKPLHYQYFPYKPEQMIWFCKPSPKHRTHHLYVIERTNPEFAARLAFRDYLRSHSQERNQYEQLKISLAEKYKNNREAYTNGKEKFVQDIVAKAAAVKV